VKSIAAYAVLDTDRPDFRVRRRDGRRVKSVSQMVRPLGHDDWQKRITWLALGFGVKVERLAPFGKACQRVLEVLFKGEKLEARQYTVGCKRRPPL